MTGPTGASGTGGGGAFGGYTSAAANDGEFIGVFNDGHNSTASLTNKNVGVVPKSGNITTIAALIDSAPGAGNQVTIEVYTGASIAALAASGLKCDISGTATKCSNTGSAPVSAGDAIAVKITETAGAPGNKRWTWTATMG